MKFSSHRILTRTMALECGMPPQIAEALSWANYMADWCIPENVSNIQVGEDVIRFPILQNYAYESILDMALSPKQEWLNIYAQSCWGPLHFVSLTPGGIVTPIELGTFMDIFGVSLSPLAERFEYFPETVYACGLGLHAWMDTFSHQGFSDIRCDANSVYTPMDLRSVVPNIGHAEAGSFPDEPFTIWERRPGEEVQNRPRWLKLIAQFAEHTGKSRYSLDCYDLTVHAKDEEEWAKELDTISKKYSDPVSFNSGVQFEFKSWKEFEQSKTYQFLQATCIWIEGYWGAAHRARF